MNTFLIVSMSAFMFSFWIKSNENQCLLPDASYKPLNQDSLLSIIELVPGKLKINVHSNSIETNEGTVHYITFITEGLSSLKQQEILFSIKTEEEKQLKKDYVGAIMQYFRTVYDLTEKGQFVNVGGSTQFAGVNQFMGMGGIIYAKPIHVPDLPFHKDALAAVLVTTEELKIYNEFGQTRLLALLGNQKRFYPYPFWFDPARKPVESKSIVENSLVSKVARYKLSMATVTLTNNTLVLQIDEHTDIPDGLFSELPVALLTGLSEDADGCLYWMPGQDRISAITPPGGQAIHLGGCFLLIGNSPQLTPVTKIYEDGFIYLSTPENCEKLKQAMHSKKNLVVEGDKDTYGLSLQWIKDRPSVYINPIDGSQITADWHIYNPDVKEKEPGSKDNRALSNIVILTPQDGIGENFSSDLFLKLMKAVEKVVSDYMIKETSTQNMVVQLSVLPNGHPEIKIRNDSLSIERIDALKKKLQEISKEYNSKVEPVVFQMNFSWNQ